VSNAVGKGDNLASFITFHSWSRPSLASARILRLKVGWVTWRAAAAVEKLRTAANSMKFSSQLSSITKEELNSFDVAAPPTHKQRLYRHDRRNARHMARLVAFEDLGMEAMYEFEVQDMPVIMAVDVEGNSIHNSGPIEWRKRMAADSIARNIGV
jgi:hypothetical protein